MRGRDGADRAAADAQTLRDAAWTQYRDRLTSAWRGGR
jgi:hypothetical protein